MHAFEISSFNENTTAESADDSTKIPLESMGLDKSYTYSAEEMHIHEMARQLKLQYPGLNAEDLSKMLAWRIKMNEPHDRLW